MTSPRKTNRRPGRGARLWVGALLVAWLPWVLATPAAGQGPSLMDRTGATRLVPEQGQLTKGLAEVRAGSESGPPPSGTAVGVHIRHVTIPDWIMGMFFATHPSHQSKAVGLSVAMPMGPPHQLVIEADWTDLTTPAGNWQGIQDSPTQAEYIEGSLAMLSVDASYRRYRWFGDNFGAFAGGGLGIGFLVGSPTRAEVLPTCVEPTASCPHWRQVGVTELAAPSPVWPVVHVMGGLEARFGNFRARLEGGLRNVVYVGITGAWAL